jgi:signal transduction histidine kinase
MRRFYLQVYLTFLGILLLLGALISVSWFLLPTVRQTNAGRIERLVNSQRSVLAAASHELRSPLARIRVGLELLSSAAKPQLQEHLAGGFQAKDTAPPTWDQPDRFALSLTKCAGPCRPSPEAPARQGR